MKAKEWIGLNLDFTAHYLIDDYFFLINKTLLQSYFELYFSFIVDCACYSFRPIHSSAFFRCTGFFGFFTIWPTISLLKNSEEWIGCNVMLTAQKQGRERTVQKTLIIKILLKTTENISTKHKLTSHRLQWGPHQKTPIFFRD